MSGSDPLLHVDVEVRRAAVASLEGEGAISRLVMALGDESWRVRKDAVERIGSWPGPAQAVLQLVDALAERDNVGRRNAAVEALTRIGEMAVGPLIDALAQTPEHRKLIVDALGFIGDRRSVPSLIAALDDRDVNVSAAAAEALGRIGGDEVEVALRAHLGGSDALLSLSCLESLRGLGATLPVSQLGLLLGDPSLRASALQILGGSDEDGAAELAAACLADSSRAVREAALLSLDRLSRGDLADARARVHRALSSALASALSPAPSSRLHGAPSSVAEDPSASPLWAGLVAGLHASSVPVRRAAASLLGLSGSASATGPLIAAIDDTALEAAAGDALVALRPASVDAIVARARELDVDRRAAVARQIVSFGAEPRLRAVAEEWLADDDDEVACAAARALGAVGATSSVAPLFEALCSDSVAPAAEAALVRLAARAPSPEGAKGSDLRDEVRVEIRAQVSAAVLAGPAAPRYARILGACECRDDLARIVALVASSDPELRAAALDAISALVSSAPDLATAVETTIDAALSDDDPQVRAVAARVLGRSFGHRPAQASARLGVALSDREGMVRAAAVRALAALVRQGHEDALGLIVAHRAVEQDALVRAIIAAALSATR